MMRRLPHDGTEGWEKGGERVLTSPQMTQLNLPICSYHNITSKSIVFTRTSCEVELEYKLRLKGSTKNINGHSLFI